jgi:hypothetical protein
MYESLCDVCLGDCVAGVVTCLILGGRLGARCTVHGDRSVLPLPACSSGLSPTHAYQRVQTPPLMSQSVVRRKVSHSENICITLLAVSIFPH